MKGYYTIKFLQQEKFYQSLIYSYMDKVLIDMGDECLYNQFYHSFTNHGEFVYRAVHTRKSAFDKYSEIEMRVNDNGVFINGKKHEDFSKRYLYALNIFKNNYDKQDSVLQN